MASKAQHHDQSQDFKNLNFTLWQLRREHELRHQHQVDLTLSSRPRERADDLH